MNLTTHKVLIIDDEPLISHALRIVIDAESDMEVVSVAKDGVDALTQLESINPDIILMDVRMPGMDGIECTRKVKERFPDILILILTTYNEESYIIDGLAHGANGYLLKGLDFPQLIATIRSTLHGQYMLPSAVAAKLSHYLMSIRKSSRDLHSLPYAIVEQQSLTKREQDILLLLGNRLSIREMADELYLSEGTIKNYLTIVYEKLEVANRYEAITLLRSGL